MFDRKHRIDDSLRLMANFRRARDRPRRQNPLVLNVSKAEAVQVDTTTETKYPIGCLIILLFTATGCFVAR